MAGEVVRIEGLDNLKRKLAEVPKAMRKRVLRNALAAGAREVRDVAKRNAMIREALVRTRDEHLFVPLHHQLRPWAMKASVTTLHRADDRPMAIWTTIK